MGVREGEPSGKKEVGGKGSVLELILARYGVEEFIEIYYKIIDLFLNNIIP